MIDSTTINMPRRSRRAVTAILLGLVALLLLTSLYILWRWYTAPKRIAQQIFSHSQPNGELKNRDGEVQGMVEQAQENKIYRLKYVADLPLAPAGQSYHGWLVDPATKEYRYAGQFYAYENTRVALTFTTEEELPGFHGIVVSLEVNEQPKEPTTIMAGGLLAEQKPPAKLPDASTF